MVCEGRSTLSLSPTFHIAGPLGPIIISMKKSELLRIVLIVFGLSTLVYAIKNFSEQIIFLSSMPEDVVKSFYFIAFGGYTLATLVLLLVAYILIFKSEGLAKRIIKLKNDDELQILITKEDAIQCSLIIISLFIIISHFPRFISIIYSILYSFIDDFVYFNEVLPDNIGFIIIYILSFFIIPYSKQISLWIVNKTEL